MEEIYFNQEGHLNDLGVALCTDAFREEKETELPEGVIEHLTVCDDCKIEVGDLLMTVSQMDIMSGESPLKAAPVLKDNHKNTRIYLTWAAGIAFFVIISVVSMWKAPEFFSREEGTAYRVNPELENLTNDVFRSETVVIKKPAVEETVQNPVRLEWNCSVKDTFTVIILDNKGQVVFTDTARGGVLTVSRKLPKGLYYWKLENSEDLLAIGKFNISDP